MSMTFLSSLKGQIPRIGYRIQSLVNCQSQCQWKLRYYSSTHSQAKSTLSRNEDKHHSSPSSHSTHTFNDNDVIGPGASSREHLATPFEQAAGPERLELLGQLAGHSPFLTNPLQIDHYGTLKDPIRVDSVEGRRIVGCTGFPKYSHDPWWFWVGEGEPTRCIDCGQAFAINKIH